MNTHTKEMLDTREQILFGEQPYDETNYRYGGIRYFIGLDREDLKRLLECGAADADTRQNGAPSIGEILAFLAQPGGETFRVGGYAVSGYRSDCRVSLDTVYAVGSVSGKIAD